MRLKGFDKAKGLAWIEVENEAGDRRKYLKGAAVGIGAYPHVRTGEDGNVQFNAGAFAGPKFPDKLTVEVSETEAFEYTPDSAERRHGRS
jgi:hypothetical protein